MFLFEQLCYVLHVHEVGFTITDEIRLTVIKN